MWHPACMRTLSSLADPVLSITAKELACVLLAACPAALSSHPSGLPTGVFAQPYSLDMPNQAPFGMKQASDSSQITLAVEPCTQPPARADQTGCKICICSLCIEAPSVFSAEPCVHCHHPLLVLGCKQNTGSNAPSSLSQKPAGPSTGKDGTAVAKEPKPRWLGCR